MKYWLKRLYGRVLWNMEEFSSLWITILCILIADLLDMTISCLNNALIPGWTEANEFARHPISHAFWMVPAAVLHLEFYIVWIVVGFVFYRFLRILFTPKLSAWIISLFLWYQIYDVVSQGVLGNMALAIFYFNWIRPLISP